jgi:hypothetical protein
MKNKYLQGLKLTKTAKRDHRSLRKLVNLCWLGCCVLCALVNSWCAPLFLLGITSHDARQAVPHPGSIINQIADALTAVFDYTAAAALMSSDGLDPQAFLSAPLYLRNRRPLVFIWRCGPTGAHQGSTETRFLFASIKPQHPASRLNLGSWL